MVGELQNGLAEISVVIIDDHDLLRAGLRELVESEQGMSVVGEAGDAQGGIDVILRQRPKVALVDLELPGGGISVLKAAAEKAPETRCLIVSAYVDYPYITAAVEAGAAGYLLKTADRSVLIEAIIAVSKGTTVLDQEVARRMQRRWRDHQETAVDLTPRELEVLVLLAGGAPNKKIAAELGLGVRTVEGYVSNLLAKLGVSTRTEAAHWAHERRIVGGGDAGFKTGRR